LFKGPVVEKEKVLIVDDEAEIREFLGEVLSCNYQTIFARNGAEALEIAVDKVPDAVILDMMMPGATGLDVVKALRQNPATEMIPVLMLTASDSVANRIDSYTSGVDDFIAKPFHPTELLSRVASRISRVKKRVSSDGLRSTLGGLTMDLVSHRAEYQGKEVGLGFIEFKILHCLIKNAGQMVDRNTLNEFVWGKELPSERAMDPHITALRKKLSDTNVELKTIYGRGYSLHLKSDI
jgi:DNA-binding response OmpR family regulator